MQKTARTLPIIIIFLVALPLFQAHDAHGAKPFLKGRIFSPERTIGSSVFNVGVEGFKNQSSLAKEGIRPETLDRMWEVFEQDVDPLRRAQAGLGLGLVLVRQIIEAHGGTITVETELGQGSSFTVTLPRWTSPQRRLASGWPATATPQR